jgi:hypothetical protein
LFTNFGGVPKQTKIVPKRTKVAKKTYIVIPILRTTSGGGAEKDNCSAETEKIGAENAKIQSAETGGNPTVLLFVLSFAYI